MVTSRYSAVFRISALCFGGKMNSILPPSPQFSKTAKFDTKFSPSIQAFLHRAVSAKDQLMTNNISNWYLSKWVQLYT